MRYMKYFNVDTELYFVQAGYEDCKEGYENTILSVNSYVVHFVYQGKGVLKTGGKTYRLSSGDAFLISPNIPAYYCADKDEPWVYMWFEITGRTAHKFLDSIALSEQSPIYHTKDTERVAKQFDCMFESLKTKNEYLYISDLLKLMAVMNETSHVRITQRSASLRECINMCIAYINSNFSKKITVKDLCEVANMERSYLFRMFKSYTGMSPQEYLIRYKMQYASRLIAIEKYSVGEAAKSVGYDDQFAFSKLFKKYHKVSPSEYKFIEYESENNLMGKFSAFVK